MDDAYLAVLTRRFGQTAVREWYAQAELVARMAFDSMVAISGAAGKPAAPESLAIVMRYASEEPEGICAVAAVSPAGPMETQAKRVLLKRALACFDTPGDVLHVEANQAPPERKIVLPPGAQIPDLHEVVPPAPEPPATVAALSPAPDPDPAPPLTAPPAPASG